MVSPPPANGHAPTHGPHGSLRVAVGQPSLPVGDLSGNRQRITETMQWAEEVEADLLVLPELAITGYPPEDLLLTPGFVDANLAVLQDLAGVAGSCVTVVGFVDAVAEHAVSDSAPRHLANAVGILYGGQVRGRVHKVLLPNYGVFDERRYFASGAETGESGWTWAMHGTDVGVLVCEDLWRPDVPDGFAVDGAQALASANASPFHRGKAAQREAVVTDTARRCGMPVAYANLVGGQDEIVFDGGSIIAGPSGEVLARAPQFEEANVVIDVPLVHPTSQRPRRFVCRPTPVAKQPAPPAPTPGTEMEDLEEVYQALVRGVADFVHGQGGESVVLGLSGGIDSSLVATLLTDALGPDRVWGVMLQGPATREVDIADAAEQAQRLGIAYDHVSIEELCRLETGAISDLLGTTSDRLGASVEGVAPRLRSSMLLAVGENRDAMLIATSNKTELAVGYGHLYGDLAGSYAPLADVPKTLVFALARWRNSAKGPQLGSEADTEPIPERIITKEPSARRTPDRPDRELPASYAVIDAVLERLVELAQSPDEVADAGFDPDVVQRVADLVEANEGTRQQAPPGPKVTALAFGRDRRQPLTSAWRPRITPPGAERPSTDLVPDPESVLEG